MKEVTEVNLVLIFEKASKSYIVYKTEPNPDIPQAIVYLPKFHAEQLGARVVIEVTIKPHE